MGFGFAEIGTVTPRPQDGNPRPRVFRLIRGSRAHQPARLQQRRARGGAGAAQRARGRSGIVGVNVGANKDAPDRAADYVAGHPPASTTWRATSPSTSPRPTRRACATCRRRRRSTICWRACWRRGRADGGRQAERGRSWSSSRPTSPRTTWRRSWACCCARGVDGIAVSNTTLARLGVSDAALGREAGGLSGRPLFHRSTVMLARVLSADAGAHPADRHRRHRLRRRGHRQDRGRRHAAAALHRAHLRGAGAARPHQAEMIVHMARGKLARIADATGRRAEEWAAKPPKG